MKSELKSIAMLMGLLTMSLSWLIPNKEYPWLPAWNEGLAFAAVFILWAVVSINAWKEGQVHSGIAWPLLLLPVLTICVTWLQYSTGLLIFYGDAFVISLYFGSFLMAVRVGGLMAISGKGKEWMTAFMFTLVISAIASVGIALIQWTKTWGFVIFLMEIDVGDRPGGNLGQINNFSTLCFIAFCGALYLYRQGELRLPATLLAGFFLIFGMALTQSRTGWLQMAFILVLTLCAEKSKQTKITISVLVVGFMVLYMAMPLMETKILISAEQRFRDLPLQDVRLTMWNALLEAISMRPWFGYGWLQTGWAQQVTAESSPILRSYMSYSHNFVLDLIVWNGWPIATIFVGLLVTWFFRHLVFRNNGSEMFLYCAVTGLFIHGLLEYPLSYAYFLMPAGLMMGYLDGTRSIFKEYSLKWKYQIALVSTFLSLYLLICADYIKAVSIDVAVRMQSAQIGRDAGYEEIHADFLVLNQLSAMYSVRIMRLGGYKDREMIVLIEKVVRRYPYSPALFQYAWMRAMRGETAAAEKQLRVMCGIYSETHCKTIAKRWEVLQKQYPQSVGLVDFPGGR